MLAQASCHRCTARARFVCHVLRAGVDVREFSYPRARFEQSACCKMLLLRHYQHSNTCPRRAWKWLQTFHTRATCGTKVLLGTNILTRARAEHGDCIVLEHIPDVKRVSGDPVRESPRGDDRWVRREVTHDGSFPHHFSLKETPFGNLRLQRKPIFGTRALPTFSLVFCSQQFLCGHTHEAFFFADSWR